MPGDSLLDREAKHLLISDKNVSIEIYGLGKFEILSYILRTILFMKNYGCDIKVAF